MLIQRLYIKDFLKALFIIGLGISAVFSIIGLIEKIDYFMPHSPPFNLILQYVIVTVPRYIQYLLPMAILLSSLFVFSQAINRKEIVAIKAAGGKMRSIFMPFVGIGVALTLFAFVIGEVIAPAAAQRVHEIKNKITKKERDIAFKEGTIFMKGKDGSIVRMSLYLPDKNIAQGISIFKFDGEGLKERIDAETAKWADDIWKLKNVTLYDIINGKITTVQEIIYLSMKSPEILQKDIKKWEEMAILELIKYQHRLHEAGFKNTKLSVDISSRLSYPLVNLFMLLLGMSLSLGGNFGVKSPHSAFSVGSGIISAGLGLLISLTYWFGYTLFLSFGYAAVIPPIAAPLIIPLLFAIVSVYLYSQIPE